MNFNKRFQMIPAFIREACLPWGDSGKLKKHISRKIIKISTQDYVTKHWVKYPPLEEQNI